MGGSSPIASPPATPVLNQCNESDPDEIVAHPDIACFTASRVLLSLLARLPNEAREPMARRLLKHVESELVAETVIWCREVEAERVREREREARAQAEKDARAATADATREDQRAYFRETADAWAAWLASVGGPEALAAWRPDPIAPVLDAEAWIAVGAWAHVAPTPEEAIRAVNAWQLETLADPERAADADRDAPEPGTPLSALLWGPEATDPSFRCSLVHVRGTRASIDDLRAALHGNEGGDE